MMPDGTQQLHYFVDQSAEYIHSMAFAPILLNWIMPGKLFVGMKMRLTLLLHFSFFLSIFIGARRLTLSVQPDDLFLGSYIWNTTTHTNPIADDSPWFRLSASDLQNLAEYALSIYY